MFKGELNGIEYIILHVHQTTDVIPSNIWDLRRADTVAKVPAYFRQCLIKISYVDPHAGNFQVRHRNTALCRILFIPILGRGFGTDAEIDHMHWDQRRRSNRQGRDRDVWHQG